MMGPKIERTGTTRFTFQAKECVNESGKVSWHYDEDESSLVRPHNLLIRIMIAKVEDPDRLLNILRGVPIRAGDEGWNCVGWVKEALDVVCSDGQTVGRCVRDWGRVRDCTMEYCREKIDEGRFDGSGGFDISIVPTYDLILKKEILVRHRCRGICLDHIFI